jgi:hypothetical protein
MPKIKVPKVTQKDIKKGVNDLSKKVSKEVNKNDTLKFLINPVGGVKDVFSGKNWSGFLLIIGGIIFIFLIVYVIKLIKNK